MKFLRLLALWTLLPSLHAAYQYDGFGGDLHKTNAFAQAFSASGNWHLQVYTDCVLSFNNNRAMLSSVNGHMAKIMAQYGTTYIPQYSAVGYFTYDALSRKLLSAEEFVFQNNVASTQTLRTGDQVGFWLEANGIRYSSVALASGSGYSYKEKTFGGGDINGDGSIRVFNYGTSAAGYELSLLARIDTPVGPAGQPLPGIALTLLLGGAGAWRLCHRKKQRQV